jgi:Protein of unknown function (DUF1566)
MVKSKLGVVSLLVVAGLAVVVHRATANAPAGRYTVTSSTAFDTKTGLTWQLAAPSAQPDWSTAAAYCTGDAAVLPGSGWRLPSLTELQTIVDDSQAPGSVLDDPTIFPGQPAAPFWTSSADVNTPGQYWYVDFSTGFTASTVAATPTYVRCVR